ncbi:MAG: hypothetical protein ACI9CF_001045 [Candidatus Omnitrophota bacterium]|jgi:hypothetical protein
MKTIFSKSQSVLVLFIVTLSTTFFVSSTLAYSNREVLVEEVTGLPQVQIGGVGEWGGMKQGIVLTEDDIVKTDDKSTARLLFTGRNKTVANIRPNTVMELTALTANADKDDTEVSIMIGSVLLKAQKLKKRSSFNVRTPSSIVGIRGTEFEVSVE